MLCFDLYINIRIKSKTFKKGGIFFLFFFFFSYFIKDFSTWGAVMNSLLPRRNSRARCPLTRCPPSSSSHKHDLHSGVCVCVCVCVCACLCVCDTENTLLGTHVARAHRCVCFGVYLLIYLPGTREIIRKKMCDLERERASWGERV